MRCGIMFGYHLHQRGKWSGDLYVADWEQILTAQHPSHIYPTRIRRKDILITKMLHDKFRFPVAEGALVPNYYNNISLEFDTAFKDCRPYGRRSRAPRPQAEVEEILEMSDHLRVDEQAQPSSAEVGGYEEVALVVQPPEPEEDYWMMPNNDLLIRNQVVPRRHLHVPTSESCPLPIEWLDVKRETFTNLDHGDLHWIEDCWTADAREGTSRELDEEFLGRTVYTLLKKKPMPGYEYQNGRLTKVHKETSRPEHIFSNNWARMGTVAKKEAQAYWAVLGPIRDRERRMSGRGASIKLEDYEQYDRVVNDTRQSLLQKPPLGMPCVAFAMSGLGEERSSQVFDTSIYMNASVNDSSGEPRGAHQENEKPAGFVSEHYFALIHKSIPIQEAKRIPAAKEAIDSEFRKSDKRGFVDWNRVQEKSDAMAYAVEN